MANPKFKNYHLQCSLFPENLFDRIPSNHPVRVVSQIVDELNIAPLLTQYKGGGTSSYHPRMMLKVLFYSYLNNTYSCRAIEQALQENLYFSWLSGNSTPDFITINRFRSQRLKGEIEHLFHQIVLLLHEAGILSLKVQYIDGTKIESASNRYTFVWRKSVEKNKEKLENNIRHILHDIGKQIREDSENEEREDYPDIDSNMLKKKINILNRELKTPNKTEKKQLEKLQNDYLPRLEKYEQQLQQCGNRNSYSKTDKDATFMRMKEDHMKNGQLKPAYNVQIATNNQFITHVGIYQRPTDTATLPDFLNTFEAAYDQMPQKVIADAGYGSEQNYEMMQENDMEAYVKYNYFHKEQKRSFRNNPFHVANLFYNKKLDFYICPMGQRMENVGTGKRKSDLDYISNVTYYQAQDCTSCPMHSACHKSKGNRIMEVNHKLNNYKRKARERLFSEEGIFHRGRRCVEPEAVFGQIKSNNKFNRFKLRGLEKVLLEFLLVAIGHNLKKAAKWACFFVVFIVWVVEGGYEQLYFKKSSFYI